MTAEQQLQANLIIAKALHGWADDLDHENVSVSDNENGGVRIFDVFTRPEDCQPAVLYLKEKYQVGIAFTEHAPHHWLAEYSDGTAVVVENGVDKVFDLYQDAVAAAYIILFMRLPV